MVPAANDGLLHDARKFDLPVSKSPVIRCSRKQVSGAVLRREGITVAGEEDPSDLYTARNGDSIHREKRIRRLARYGWMPIGHVGLDARHLGALT